MLYPTLIRPAVFRLTRDDPEIAHELTVRVLQHLGAASLGRSALRAVYAVQDPRLEREVFGIRFPNPVGLAGGFDKDGEAVPGLAALGFGFIEVGTVTWHAQPGNPKPRLFRLPASGAVINRMGFNNAGAEALAARLQALGPRPVPVGASLGKSKVMPLEAAVEDYRRSLEALYPYADYFAVNVSSPNTPGLRSLQDRDYLEALLGTLIETARRLAGEARVKPILVKIAPDLSHDAVVEVLEVAADNGVAGIIATNTTLARDGLDPRDAALAGESGGLSGAPLTARAREMVAFIHQMAGDALPVVGVGGVMSPDDALRLFDAGASLVQVYTGMIYAGPAFAGQINRAILDRME